MKHLLSSEPAKKMQKHAVVMYMIKQKKVRLKKYPFAFLFLDHAV